MPRVWCYPAAMTIIDGRRTIDVDVELTGELAGLVCAIEWEWVNTEQLTMTAPIGSPDPRIVITITRLAGELLDP